jgi:hypothetical protein
MNIEALEKIGSLKETHLRKIVNLLKSVYKLTSQYQNIEYSDPFNIVLAASDIYYRENYHSDIIAYILKNNKETIKYFLEYINLLSDLPQIDSSHYLNTEIIREEDKIDVLLIDKKSKHCVIFENKINNAGDMSRQLPRYYKKQISKGFIVDRIVYYSLDGKKIPDKLTWTSKDNELFLEKIMVFGAASTGEANDFIHSFLISCKSNAQNEQERSFYCQYIDLLEFLRRDQMDNQLMEKFYSVMVNPDKYNSALSIRDMLDKFKTFRRDRIYDRFVNNYAPFEKPYKYLKNYTGYEYIRDLTKEHIKIDIYTEEKETTIVFWIQDPKIKSDLIFGILKQLGEEKSFEKEEANYYIKVFKFPEEDEIFYKYLTKFFGLLRKNKDSIKC